MKSTNMNPRLIAMVTTVLMTDPSLVPNLVIQNWHNFESETPRKALSLLNKYLI